MRLSSRLFLTLAAALALDAHALEHKDIKDVEISDLTRETQKTIHADGVHLVWWIPPEYWAASIKGDASIATEQRKALMDILEKYSMLAVVQAEVTPFGAFSFYERDMITKGLKIEIVNGKDRKTVTPLEKVPEDLELLLKVLSPILEAALGNMGKNLNFFVLADRVKGDRLLSPYGHDTLSVSLTSKQGTVLGPAAFEFPLDALYVPRQCPNGKPAHVSWVVCPWDGSKLPE
jgi:hypothetical protein